jgi:hypothetical protein
MFPFYVVREVDHSSNTTKSCLSYFGETDINDVSAFEVFNDLKELVCLDLASPTTLPAELLQEIRKVPETPRILPIDKPVRMQQKRRRETTDEGSSSTVGSSTSTSSDSMVNSMKKIKLDLQQAINQIEKFEKKYKLFKKFQSSDAFKNLESMMNEMKEF